MTLTTTQVEARRGWIGASDVPAIVGVSPWKDAFSLWAEKTGKVPAADAGDAAKWGNLLEPVILQCTQDALGRRVVKSTGTFAHPDLACVRANPDGFVEVCRRGEPLVEAKSTSISEGWGEPGTDQVPESVLVQVTMQMRCTGSAFAHVARLFHSFGHPDFSLYTVAFSKSLADALDEACGEFWDNHVQKDTPPDPTALSLPTLGRMRREAKVVQVDPEIVAAFASARAAAKDAEQAADEAKAKLLLALGDGDAADVPGFKVRYSTITTRRLDQESLREAAPDLVALYTKDTTYTRLDVRAVKEKK